MLLNSFFLTEPHNPDKPAETWSLFYEKTSSGNYSKSLDWGKYKIIISGAGGSGAIFLRHPSAVNMELYNITNGYAGEEKTIFVNVLAGETKTAHGTVGSGALGPSVQFQTESYGAGHVYYEVTTTAGAVGVGWGNGWQPFYKYQNPGMIPDTHNIGGWIGGSGGGGTNVRIDDALSTEAYGGDGGDVTINFGGFKESLGGTGGGGGTITGTGASGGVLLSETAFVDIIKTAGDGSDGYIRIYKSNLKPEDV